MNLFLRGWAGRQRRSSLKDDSLAHRGVENSGADGISGDFLAGGDGVGSVGE